MTLGTVDRAPATRGMVLAAIALLLALVTAITSLVLSTRLSNEDAILADMDQVVRSVSDQAAANTENFLFPAVSTCDLLVSLVDDGLLDITSPTAKTLLLDILDSNEMLDGVYVGSADGEFLYLSRPASPGEMTFGNAAYTSKSIESRDGKRTVEITEYNRSAEEIGTRLDNGDTYDPRTRPWYSEAEASVDSAVWTDPYTFFESGLPGVTRSKAIRNNGEVSFVVGVDIGLSRLSEFMAERAPSPNGGAFIMTKSQQMMVAYPDIDAISTSEGVLQSGQVDDPAVRLAGTAISGRALIGATDNTSAEVDGTRSQFVYTELPVNRDWVLTAWSPQSDFLAETQSTTRTNRWLALGTGVVILVVLLGVALWVFLHFDRSQRRIVQSEAASEQSAIERNRAQLELANTVDQLESSNRDLEAYAYAAAHDLRTPLRAIGGYSELIGRESESDSPDLSRIREWSDLIVSGYDRMGRTMDSLLEHARLSKTEIDLDAVEAIDAQAIVEAVVSDLVSEFSRAECTLVVGDLPRARIDAPQLSRVFQNLLENSLRFREPDRPLEVTVEGSDYGDVVCFRVSDNGVGITGADRVRIFESFSQAHDSVGLGIGLSLVKRIVLDHGGEIWAQSEVGEGSVFEFTLPGEVQAHQEKEVLPVP